MTKAFAERLVLPCRDMARSLAVYRDVLGFSVIEGPGAHSIDLDHLGADGGGIRLIAGSGDPPPASSLGCPGPYGITLYTTDFDAVIESLGRAMSETPIAISYTFPGTDTLVREGTVPGPDGINVFLVEYDPSRHRCCINANSDARVSEIAAVGFVVDDLESALPEHERALGARVYMNEIFGGSSVERMNGLTPGSKLHVAFLRGASSGNARVELLERIGTVAPGRGQVEGVELICRVPESVPATPITLVPGSVLDRVWV